MELGLTNKKVFVLASSTGLGFAIAKAFAEEGAKVAICSRNEEHLKKAKMAIPGVFSYVSNLNEEGAARRLTKQVIKDLNGIDILITNAGGPPSGSFMDLGNKEWKEGFNRLWLSATESIQEASFFMKKQKYGRILLSTSAAAKEPIANLTVSNALRAGLLGLMKTLSFELAPYHITVNALLPGYIATDRLKELPISEEQLASQIPLKRLGKPQEYASLALFLGSEKAAYITGQAIACDGGLLRGL